MSVTVKFIGICTHVTPPGLGKYRVILVYAHNGAYIPVLEKDEKKFKKIPPHIPKLKIKAADIVGPIEELYGLEPLPDEGECRVWRLGGVYLDLNTTGDEFHQTADCKLPHLNSSDPAVSVFNEVTTNEQAACYFDFKHGAMSSDETEHGAIHAVVNADTDGAPALHVTCFWNRQESWIHLAPNAGIVIEHVGNSHEDSDDDFLLHYRVFDYVPDDAFVPKEDKKRNRNKIPGDISIGCSNSQWP